MKSFSRAALAATVIFLAAPSQAYATKDVSAPAVSKGKLKAEARFGIEDDNLASRDDRLQQIYLLEYGATDWWSTRINFKLTRLGGSADVDYTATEWENKFQLFFEKQDGFNGAFKIVYGWAANDGVPDTLQLKTMAERKFGPVKLRTNLALDWETGSSSTKTAVLTSALQGLVPVTDDLSAGIEWFASYGEINAIPGFDLQEHQIGPVFTYKLDSTISIETGYLFGVSDRASDGLFKLFIKANL